MGFLIWCSFLLVSLVGWMFFIEAFSSFREKIEVNFKSKNTNFFRLVTLALLQPSLKNWLSTIMNFENSKNKEHRLFLLGLSLIRLTSVMALIAMGVFFMKLNSSYLLILAGLLWIMSRWWISLKSFFFVFLGLGLFLLGLELSLRQSSLVFSSAIELPFLFSIGDSLWTTLFGVFFISATLSFISQIPNVGFFIATILVLTGLASVPSAMTFVLGDIFGAWLLCVFFIHKSLIKKYFYIRFFIFILSSLFILLGFEDFFLLVQKVLPGFYSSELRTHQFFIMVCLLFGLETFLSMLFFHFYYKKSLRPLREI